MCNWGLFPFVSFNIALKEELCDLATIAKFATVQIGTIGA